MMSRVPLFFRGIPRHIWILVLIISVGIFLRAYHFHDWLPFKGDAFRDATLVSNPYREGIESLPLLGPRAAGTMLRLGPLFYYFQYASARLFHSLSAPVLAYPDFFFAVLALPLSYLFVRRYFSVGWALALVGMLATSFLAIEYSRFAWNPNSTVFFVLLFSLAVFRLFDADVVLSKKKYGFAVLTGLTLAIATQLHFSSFLGLPIVLALFLLWQWPATKQVISLKIVACFLASFLLVYAPVLMSEYFKHGENSRQFIAALSSKPSVHGVTDNVVQATHAFANQSARILLGTVDPGQKVVWLIAIFLVLGFLANIFLLRGEGNESRQSFLRWTLLLMTVYFILYTPLAYTIDRPRFFLPFLMVPYIYCGYIILALRKKLDRPVLLRTLTVFGVSVVILSNSHSVFSWFSELRESERITESTAELGKNIKGRSFWLVWTHFERAAAAMDESCPEGDPIFLFPRICADRP
jgi:4-amino-4-deoxy-L-arabinose transferase-like glycosyltransferase